MTAHERVRCDLKEAIDTFDAEDVASVFDVLAYCQWARMVFGPEDTDVRLAENVLATVDVTVLDTVSEEPMLRHISLAADMGEPEAVFDALYNIDLAIRAFSEAGRHSSLLERVLELTPKISAVAGVASIGRKMVALFGHDGGAMPIWKVLAA